MAARQGRGGVFPVPQGLSTLSTGFSTGEGDSNLGNMSKNREAGKKFVGFPQNGKTPSVFADGAPHSSSSFHNHDITHRCLSVVL